MYKNCKDCGIDVEAAGEYCMLFMPVWMEASAGADMLCIGCIENRLGRRLTRADFDMHYQQNSKPGKSARMMDRMAT